MENQEVRKMYIDGQWVLSETGETREVLNPANNEVLALVAEGGANEVRKAVAAAKRAFYEDGWGETLGAVRANYLNQIADKLESRLEEFAVLETLDNGRTLRESRISVNSAIGAFRYYAGLINKPDGMVYGVNDNVQAMTVREPIGVCALITPWNLPLQLAVWKIAPALAAGNAIVLKPSELTPLSAILLFEIMDEAGLPKGVANLVLGGGAVVGQELAIHPDVEKISFTGGTETGRSIMRNAAGNMKNISLELGGKSPMIVFEDADIETAVDHALYAIFYNQGEVCSAGSRLLLQDSIHDRFVADLAEKARKIRVGNGMDETAQVGPLVSKAHQQKVLNYIEIGKQEGATLLCGGHAVTEGELAKGNFVAPTIFVDTKPDMRIVQEEIFGPVLVVQKFGTEEEAVKLANDSVYGLAGAVYTQDGTKALRVVKKLRAGITWINMYHNAYLEAPWGGYKQSGIGRDLRIYGYESFTEVKQINTSLNVQPVRWYEG